MDSPAAAWSTRRRRVGLELTSESVAEFDRRAAAATEATEARTRMRDNTSNGTRPMRRTAAMIGAVGAIALLGRLVFLHIRHRNNGLYEATGAPHERAGGEVYTKRHGDSRPRAPSTGAVFADSTGSKGEQELRYPLPDGSNPDNKRASRPADQVFRVRSNDTDAAAWLAAGSTVLCTGEDTNNRQCRFRNLCWNSVADEWVFLVGPESYVHK
jgi:hypothetical protein